jgi:hypothetical protein
MDEPVNDMGGPYRIPRPAGGLTVCLTSTRGQPESRDEVWMSGTPARRIEDATPLQAAVEWKLGVLCLAGAALFRGMFGLPAARQRRQPILSAVPLVLSADVQLDAGCCRAGAGAASAPRPSTCTSTPCAGRQLAAHRDRARSVAADGPPVPALPRASAHADPAGQGYRDDDRLLWESAHMVTTPRSHAGHPRRLRHSARCGRPPRLPLRWTLEVEASVEARATPRASTCLSPGRAMTTAAATNPMS